MKTPDGYLFYIFIGAPITITMIATKDIQNSFRSFELVKQEEPKKVELQ